MVEKLLSSKRPEGSTFYEQVFKTLGIPSVVLSRSGEILHANPAFDRMVGLPANLEGAGDNFLDYLNPGEQSKLSKILADLQGADGQRSVCLHLTSGQDKRWGAEVSLTVLPHTEEVLATILSNRDITQAKEQLERKADDLQNLVYLICHNLKAPVVSILGFCKLLMEKVAAQTEESGHYLERVQKNAARLNTMVHDVLEFSRFSRPIETSETVSLAEVLSDIRSEYFFLIKEKSIDFKIAEDLPLVYGDSEALHTLFSNLVDNAIKYAGEISKPVIEVGWENKPRFLVFWVKDNGVGLEVKYHEKVFDLFERAQAPSRIEGTGVGLAIVKRIVERDGGYVRFVSQPGKGSTVFFTLPKQG
ncbi:MAG: ATP-binding protein [bacterium]